MKRFNTIFITLSIALLFSACDKKTSEFIDSNSSLDSKITIPNCEEYIELLSGDTVINGDENSSIKTILNTDGSKKVCVTSGSAYIQRD
jgi:hypothetical protein